MLQHLILERLSESRVSDEVADLVLAACLGSSELEAVLLGTAAAPPAKDTQATLTERPPAAFLRSVSIQGFRGVGAAATLEIAPGPGLTLVVGRNGSGKSSFAEGLELLMTGANSRWVNRTKVWRDGWQNLHFDGDTRLGAQFMVEGQPGDLVLERTWEHGADLTPGDCRAVRDGGETTTLDALGWSTALSRYRPFLSYNELGSMFDELKTMYDALAAILGLEDVDELGRTLREARLARERAARELKVEVEALRARAEAIDDERAQTVATALGQRSVDLDAIELTLAGVGAEGDPAGQLADLRALTAVLLPGGAVADAAVEELRTSAVRLSALSGSDAARAAGLAALLEAALRHAASHDDGECPVCGTTGVIDDAWRWRTEAEVVRLRTEARAVQEAEGRQAAARAALADLLQPEPPAVLARSAALGLDPSEVEAAWSKWSMARGSLDSATGVDAAEQALLHLRRATGELTDAAQVELDRREDAWRPVAQRLAEWLPGARVALAASERLPQLKAAEAWVKATAGDLQAQRLAPIADAAKANWEQLRQASNVSLDGFHLRRTGNMRAAEVAVNVDGSDASAFGVMSQGELHALAVSVFLPRAALPESPFRFMVIDDPVQSMDPAKVDGLAGVLHAAAADRQVVVFTHDERLPEAVRRLDIPATVLEVTRRPRSVVEVRTALTPIERYLEDAGALVRTEHLPEGVAERVVPGFCRHALEAACVEVVRRRRLTRGDSHIDVDAGLDQATTLYKHLALALFDDAERAGEVVRAVNGRFGKWAGDVVVAANRGVHAALGVDLRDFVRDSGLLARQLAAAS